MYPRDLTGLKFHKLTVLSKDNSKKKNISYWICQCECGNIVSVRRDHLISNKKDAIFSCGCYRKKSYNDRRRN